MGLSTRLLKCPHDLWLPSEQVIRELGASHNACDLFSEVTIIRHILFIRIKSLNIAHTHGEGIKLYLLKGRILKNLWPHFKTSTPSEVKALRVILSQGLKVRRAEIES